jgi:DNA-binding response OmpR family regulator
MSSKLSILYVDDEDSLRILVPSQLSLEGFTVEAADDGDTAVQMLANKSYDVVLLDIRMPRMNGIEVLKHVKDNKMSARVIMLTGVDDLTVAMEAVKNGAMDYLTKPYDINTLVACIKRVAGN